jgi:lycopene cyclase domain-containing protein
MPIEYVYLSLNIGTLLFPLLLSFDKKVAFYQYWPGVFGGIIFAGAVFIIWDHYFTHWGIWDFSRQYTLGIWIWGLPLEEWLFFLTVPYATVFVYIVYPHYFRIPITETMLKIITLCLIISLLLVGIRYYDRLYTVVTFTLTSVLLAWHWYYWQTRHLERVFVGWIINLVPFFLINGVLTALPVVVYNNNENLGIRLYTIPFEDTFYGFSLYLLVIEILEHWRVWMRKPIVTKWT